MNLFNAFNLDFYTHASSSAIMDTLHLTTEFWHLPLRDSHISLLYQEKWEILLIHYIFHLGNNQTYKIYKYVHYTTEVPDDSSRSEK